MKKPHPDFSGQGCGLTLGVTGRLSLSVEGDRGGFYLPAPCWGLDIGLNGLKFARGGAARQRNEFLQSI